MSNSELNKKIYSTKYYQIQIIYYSLQFYNLLLCTKHLPFIDQTITEEEKQQEQQPMEEDVSEASDDEIFDKVRKPFSTTRCCLISET